MAHHKQPVGIKALLFTMVFSLAAGWLGQTSILRAEDTSNYGWLDAELTYQVEEIVTGAEAKDAVISAIDGGHCWEYEFNQKSTKNNKVNYPKTKVGCAVDTAYGVAAQYYFHEYGEEYAGEIAKVGSNVYYPIPNSSTLVAVSGTRNNTLRLYPDFASYAETANVNGNEMTYILKNNHVTVSDSANNPIQINDSPPSASKNGRWVMAYSDNRFSMRVDLNSGNGSPLLFGGAAAGPLRQAITNDGRFVAIFYIKSKKTIIYDLSTCKPMVNAIAEDCDSADISAYLNQHLGSLQNILRLEFIDENHLVIFVQHTPAGGVFTRSKIQLAPSGTQMLRLDGGYIAMGDSYAAGEGDLDSSFYEVGTDEPENKCHLSRRSYPYLINQSLGPDEFHSVACSGALAEDIAKTEQYDETLNSDSPEHLLPGTQPQLTYIIRAPRLITLSIGGNDVGFGSKLTECVLWGGTCKYAELGEHRVQVAKEIAQMGRTLKDTYEQIISKTDSKTKLYVVGYPQTFNPEGGSCGLNVKLNEDERRFIFEATKYMNRVIAAATSSAGAYYLDIENALEGKNLCSLVSDSDMAVNGLTNGNDKKIPWWIGLGLGNVPGLIAVQNLGIANESYHPNQNGHSLMYDSIMNHTSGNPLTHPVCSADISQIICPRGDGKVPLPDVSYWGTDAYSFASGLHFESTLGVNKVPTYKPMIVLDDNDGPKAKIVVDHLKPGSTATIEIHSDPVLLGVFDVDSAGRLDEPIDIPSGVAAGFHTLRVRGQNTVGEPIEYYEHIFIPGPEGDLDANGVPDEEQACGFVEDSGVDNDQDGIDDSCDPYIAAVAPESNPNNTDIQETSINTTSEGIQTTAQATNQVLLTDTSQSTPAIQLAVATTNNGNPLEVKVAGDFDGKPEFTVDSIAENYEEDNSTMFAVGLISVTLMCMLVYLLRRYSMN